MFIDRNVFTNTEPGELLMIVTRLNNMPARQSRQKNVIICGFFYQRICGESAAI